MPRFLRTAGCFALGPVLCLFAAGCRAPVNGYYSDGGVVLRIGADGVDMWSSPAKVVRAAGAVTVVSAGDPATRVLPPTLKGARCSVIGNTMWIANLDGGDDPWALEIVDGGLALEEKQHDGGLIRRFRRQ